MNNLNEYSVVYIYWSRKLITNWEKKCICIDAAEGIMHPCGREYGFSENDTQASQLDKLASNELSGLPTNNLDTERNFSKLPLWSYSKKDRKNIIRKWKHLKSWSEKFTFGKNKRKVTKSVKWKDYSKKLLKCCKSWGCPNPKLEELKFVLLAKPDSQRLSKHN